MRSSFPFLLLTLMLPGRGVSDGSAPAPAVAPQCMVAPAPSNPPGGGGTPAQIQIDPGVCGTADMSKVTVFAFSQIDVITKPLDPEIVELVPDIVPRAWNRWDLDGLQPSDFNFQAPAAARAQGTLFIGATTASVLFPDEPVFPQTATCNAAGQLVPHVNPGEETYYRGSISSPQYQDYLVNIGEIQIDGGVDGLFFDETQGSYVGATYDGNEGFDDANIADFGGFLCAKYPGLTPDQWAAKFGIAAADNLDCTLTADQRGRGFDYRGYMARLGVQNAPMSASNPLAGEWGWGANSRVDLSSGSFTTTYANLVYWQNIVLRLRTYARQKYGKEIYITGNGIFPFVDFQMPNMYEYNSDAPDGSTVNYLPLTSDGHFDGTASWQPALQNFRKISRTLVGFDMPMTLFIDWPGTLMSSYYDLALQDRQDYMRSFTAESYANGILFSWPLRTSLSGDPTADDLGMMGLFQQLRAFYAGHAALYHGGTSTGSQAAISAPNVMQHLVRLPDGSLVLHMVNHNYAGGFETQRNFAVSFPMAQQPARVTLASPDFASDQTVNFTYADGLVQVTVPQLVSYVTVLASVPLREPPSRDPRATAPVSRFSSPTGTSLQTSPGRETVCGCGCRAYGSSLPRRP